MAMRCRWFQRYPYVWILLCGSQRHAFLFRSDFIIPHKLTLITTFASERYFWQGRHQDLCNDVQGGIMYCGECNQTVSTVDIVNMSLQRWRDTLNPGKRAQLNRPDTNIPLSKERLDVAAYTTSYVPHEWRLRIRKRCFLGKQSCKRNTTEV